MEILVFYDMFMSYLSTVANYVDGATKHLMRILEKSLRLVLNLINVWLILALHTVKCTASCSCSSGVKLNKLSYNLFSRSMVACIFFLCVWVMKFVLLSLLGSLALQILKSNLETFCILE